MEAEGKTAEICKALRIDFQFRDAFRDVNSARVDATTHNSGARLDYIFLERPLGVGKVSGLAWISKMLGILY